MEILILEKEKSEETEENKSALFLLPDIGCGTHENIVE